MGMDMTVIDLVAAHALEAGDTIQFQDEEGRTSLQEIKSVEDLGSKMVLTLEDYEDVEVPAEFSLHIYGYEAD